MTEKEQVDIRNLQDKFHSLLDQRNNFNDLAREARDARNLLNDARRELSGQAESHKTARDSLNNQMREHKELRNNYQDQAKALIAAKKGKAGAMERSLPLQVRRLRNDIQTLAEKQETTVLNPAKERDLVDSIRDKKVELAGLEKELGKQKAMEVDLDDTDQAIDQLFAKADEEHEKVVELQTKAQEQHDKFVTCIKEIRVLVGESNEKHNESVGWRGKADEYHEKAMELREKVMAVKGERRAEFQAQRKEMQDVNNQAKQNVNDPKALEKVSESALDMLKKGGKITL